VRCRGARAAAGGRDNRSNGVIDATAEIRLGATIHAYPSALYAEERVLLCIG
jgi:hypothetical protein